MLTTSHVSLPVPEPLTLLDATLLFLIQVLLAQHPDLLAPPEEAYTRRPATPLRAAQHILDAVRAPRRARDALRPAILEITTPSSFSITLTIVGSLSMFSPSGQGSVLSCVHP